MLRLSPFLIATLTLPAGISGQTSSSSPAGLLNQEGAGVADMFGAFNQARYALLDGEYRGTAMSLKSIDFRPDGGYSNSAGRSWRRVQLHMAEGNHDPGTLRVAFNSLAQTPRTKVFDSVVRWPVQKPRSTLLANGTPWPASSIRGYRLDNSPGLEPTHARWVGKLGNFGVGKGCIDRNATVNEGGFISSAVFTNGGQFDEPRARNAFDVFFYSFYTGPRSPVAYLLGAPNFTGLSYPGIQCNKLWVDTTKPIASLFKQADRTGRSGPHRLLFPFQSAFVGQKVCLQAAWEDSGNRSLMLSSADWTVALGLPMPLPKRRVVYQHDPQKTWGTPVIWSSYVPLTRLTR